MSATNRAAILGMVEEIMTRQGKAGIRDEGARLADVGFRSLDFAELALRVEDARGRPLVVDAAALRSIVTLRDVLDFMEAAARDGG